jgi:D-alanyl-D-alanine dipeptidase
MPDNGDMPVNHRMNLLFSAAVVAGAVGSAAPVSAAPDGGVPPVSAAASAAGFIDVRTVVPDAIIDLRYATANNFVGVPLYPPGARCLVHESLGAGLTAAADALRPASLTLVFWDCYRPHDVQVRLFQAVPDPDWVAEPGDYARSHEAGRSVDVTLASGGQLLDMGTDFDAFSPLANAYATDGVTTRQQANRSVLRNAMAKGWLAQYVGEWWHFDGPGASVDRPILDVPVN